METLIHEQLLLLSIVAISGIHLNEDDHEPKKITDLYSMETLREIARQYQVYSYDTLGDRSLYLQKTITIMRLCDYYFSVEEIWAPRAIKIRWMADLDFKTMIENEKEVFDKMDQER